MVKLTIASVATLLAVSTFTSAMPTTPGRASLVARAKGGKGQAAAASASAAASAAAATGAAAANATAAPPPPGVGAQGLTTTVPQANADAQTSQCLLGSNIQDGSNQDGTVGNGAEAGEVASLTSPNNFINFCSGTGLPLTNGLQIKTGSCNPIPMGSIPPVTNIPSAKFVFPQTNTDVPANQPFTIQLAIQNLNTGNFVNAQANYYSAPQQLKNNIIVGHSHVVVEDVGNDFLGKTPLNPQNFAFFKGLNDPAAGGILTADVTAGLPAGCYRVASINTDSNHMPALAPVAQHGSLDDAVYFSSGGKACTGNANAGVAAAAAAGAAAAASANSTAAATTAAAASTNTAAAAAAASASAAAAGKGGKAAKAAAASAAATTSSTAAASTKAAKGSKGSKGSKASTSAAAATSAKASSAAKSSATSSSKAAAAKTSAKSLVAASPVAQSVSTSNKNTGSNNGNGNTQTTTINRGNGQGEEVVVNANGQTITVPIEFIDNGN